MQDVNMPPRFSSLAAGVVLAACVLTGCNNAQPQTPPTVVTTTPAPTTPPVVTTTPPGTVTTPTVPATKVNVNAGPGASTGENSAVGDAVNAAIVRNKQMTGSRVEAVVDASGTARLTGMVQNQQQKALAATTADKVPGVTHVVNKLVIVSTGGAKPPQPKVITKTKVVVVHDKSTPASSSSASSSSTTSDSGNGSTDNTSGSGNGATSTTPSTPATPGTGNGP